MRNQYHAGLINRDLFNEIYEKRKTLLKNDSLILKYRKGLERCIRDYSIKKSMEIESDNLFPLTKRKKIARQAIKNMKEAWDYLSRKRSKLICEEDIIEVNYLINSKGRYATRGFRKTNTWISASSHPTVSVQSVPSEIRILTGVMDSRVSALEKAMAYHFHIARIHPFQDGNGRTARMIQDYKLIKNNLPPAGISKAERYIYYDLLDKACVDYIDLKNVLDNKYYGMEKRKAEIDPQLLILGNKPNIKSFMTFLASKVNDNLERIME